MLNFLLSSNGAHDLHIALADANRLPLSESMALIIHSELDYRAKLGIPLEKELFEQVKVDTMNSKKLGFLVYQNLRTGTRYKVPHIWYNATKQQRLEYYEFVLSNVHSTHNANCLVVIRLLDRIKIKYDEAVYLAAKYLADTRIWPESIKAGHPCYPEIKAIDRLCFSRTESALQLNKLEHVINGLNAESEFC